MHYMYSHDIYFSKTYHLSVYETTYKTIGHTHPVIVTASDKGEYSPPKKRPNSSILIKFRNNQRELTP